MALARMMRNSSLASYGRAIREAPREMIFNRHLLLSTLIYALGGMPVIYDQGAASAIPSLPGFQNHFGITSGANPNQIRNFVSIVYIGYGVGAALTFFINDRFGRIWSYRLYNLVYIVGTFITMFAPNLGVLYAGRVVQGLGLGPLTVLGTMAIVEIAPPQIRGLLASWFNLAMGIGLILATACTLGCYRHMAPSKLQFQIVMLVPMVYLAMVTMGTLFVEESPRWLFLVNRREEAVAGLARIRGLPVEDPRVQGEIAEIEADINRIAEAEGNNAGLWTIVKETFSTSSNLRRVQQSLMTYALAQLSGANLITSYFIPIMAIVGVSTSTDNSLFLSTMYGTSKFFFLLIATFLLIDLIGRRASLFAGATVQMLTHIYLAVYIKISQERQVSNAASQGAVAALFIHAFGYAIGLYLLPYVFGGELWPNRIRSFGGALGQTFHWLFIYGMQFSMPSLLANLNKWGAFLFFGAWCLVAILYTFLMVPEVSGLTVEEIEDIFQGSWFNAYQTSRQRKVLVGQDDKEAAITNQQTLTTSKSIDGDD